MPVQTPPELTSLMTKEVLENLFERGRSSEFQAALQEANNRYFHFEELRYRPMPVGISVEEFWVHLKMGRNSVRKFVPFVDKKGRPFFYTVQDSMLKTLNEIDLWSGRRILTDQPDGLPSEPQYVISSLMEEAIASSQLEGASTTRRIAKEMLRSGRKPKNESERMILNNWITMRHILANRNMKLDVGGLCKIQAMITDGTLKKEDSGHFRTSDDVVVVNHLGETIHQPPTFSEIPKRIEELCRFANDETPHPWIHPAIKASMLHFWMGHDHPFVDGNGRTARALLYWYMLKHGYFLFQYLAISRYFLDAPAQYAKAYEYTETDDGDLTYFLIHNLEVICKSLQALQEYLRRKQEENNQSFQLLRKYPGLNYRQRNLIYHAVRHPEEIYTIETHKTVHDVAYETARKDLMELSDKGLLIKKEGRKGFIYLPHERLANKLNLNPTVNEPSS